MDIAIHVFIIWMLDSVMVVLVLTFLWRLVEVLVIVVGRGRISVEWLHVWVWIEHLVWVHRWRISHMLHWHHPVL